MPTPSTHVTTSFSHELSRSSIRRLASLACLWLSFAFLIIPAAFGQTNPTCQGHSDPQPLGYYKDLLIDRGVGLETGFNSVIALELGIEFDTVAANLSQAYEQNLLLVGGFNDKNGILLYPDGQPRFRMVWVMGGLAPDHGASLGADGRARFRAFFDEGGSYSGSCAGAFVADANDRNPNYLNLWPGKQNGSGHQFSMPDVVHNVTVKAGSPFATLPGFSFFEGQILGPVYHIGGGYLRESNPVPPNGTEILLTYSQMWNTSIPDTEGRAACWAYKKDCQSGRLVNMGSHTETALSPASLEISKAMITYALAGQGKPDIKATLPNGNPWCMNKATEDQDPSHTRIGDRQYHHFKIELTQPSVIQIDLDEEAGWNSEAFDLHLYVAVDELAFANAANLVASDISAGLTKSLVTPQLPAGTYFIGVTCPNTVDYNSGNIVFPYNGSVAVLNGVAYRIRATWDNQQPGPYFTNLADQYCTNADPVTLQGWPTGGTFQGPGVTGNIFSPDQLAPGSYGLSYTVDCATVEQTVTIDAAPAGPQYLGIVYHRPAGGNPTCTSNGPSAILVTDIDPAYTDYQWEVMNASSGSFVCHNQNSVVFQFSPKVSTAQVRVAAMTDCGITEPSDWLTLNVNDL